MVRMTVWRSEGRAWEEHIGGRVGDRGSVRTVRTVGSVGRVRREWYTVKREKGWAEGMGRGDGKRDRTRGGSDGREYGTKLHACRGLESRRPPEMK